MGPDEVFFIGIEVEIKKYKICQGIFGEIIDQFLQPLIGMICLYLLEL